MSPENSAPGPGYSHAVTVTGRLAFVAGQIAVDAEGNLVGAGDLRAQATQALRNLHGVLRALGAVALPD
jgi:enamine deaminase RidA (YjgF/YER057c/UK114 family)